VAMFAARIAELSRLLQYAVINPALASVMWKARMWDVQRGRFSDWSTERCPSPMGTCTFLEDHHQEHPLRSKETPAQGHDEPQLLLPACWRTAGNAACCFSCDFDLGSPGHSAYLDQVGLCRGASVGSTEDCRQPCGRRELGVTCEPASRCEVLK
jgi:hypothetical protein